MAAETKMRQLHTKGARLEKELVKLNENLGQQQQVVDQAYEEYHRSSGGPPYSPRCH